MKTKLLTGIILAGLIVFATAVFSQNEAGQDDMITMDNSAFTDPVRPAAVFDHDIHNETAELEDDCAVCHHVYENGVPVEDESSEDSACSECHSLKPTNDNPVHLRMAFHKRCKSCHFEEKKGPVLCGQCHMNKGRLQ